MPTFYPYKYMPGVLIKKKKKKKIDKFGFSHLSSKIKRKRKASLSES